MRRWCNITKNYKMNCILESKSKYLIFMCVQFNRKMNICVCKCSHSYFFTVLFLYHTIFLYHCMAFIKCSHCKNVKIRKLFHVVLYIYCYRFCWVPKSLLHFLQQVCRSLTKESSSSSPWEYSVKQAEWECSGFVMT